MEQSTSLVLGLGLLIGVVFGIVGQITWFCYYRGLKQRWTKETGTQLHSFALALAVAILGTQLSIALGWIDLSQTVYLSPRVSWLLLPLGGLLFGYGMALANGCGARALVLLGQGNLRSLVVLLALGISALITLTGLLAPWRLGLANQTLLQLHVVSPSQWGASWLWIGAAVLLLAAFAFKAPATPHRTRHLVGGFIIGLLVVGGWLSTGWIGLDPFNPVPPTSLTFVLPIGETIQYAMLAPGMNPKFAILVVVGLFVVSLLSALVRKDYQLRGFDSPHHLLRSVAGGCLMGVGGVFGLGCTIGQGLSGISTLAFSSVVTLIFITLGAWLHHLRHPAP